MYNILIGFSQLPSELFDECQVSNEMEVTEMFWTLTGLTGKAESVAIFREITID